MDRAPQRAGDVDVVEAWVARGLIHTSVQREPTRVIPGPSASEEPGIHNPDRCIFCSTCGYGFRARRFARPGMTSYIFNNRLALPLRIFALSSSDSGTVCIQSSAGGFMTNGQSTANRI